GGAEKAEHEAALLNRFAAISTSDAAMRPVRWTGPSSRRSSPIAAGRRFGSSEKVQLSHAGECSSDADLKSSRKIHFALTWPPRRRGTLREPTSWSEEGCHGGVTIHGSGADDVPHSRLGGCDPARGRTGVGPRKPCARNDSARRPRCPGRD